ncbi:hypothetical protein [Rhizobium sp. NPDC090279]|uniref:hypothetical protein n=1 Tax=Rhizobium sp. NPDC090279 TaxID=3364499 RepID=UPI00383A128A
MAIWHHDDISPVLERGNKNPTVATLDKIAETLSCDILEFCVPVADNMVTVKPLASVDWSEALEWQSPREAG